MTIDQPAVFRISPEKLFRVVIDYRREEPATMEISSIFISLEAVIR
jgi:hypothetical protein